MINITLHKNFCLIEPQGPLTNEDFKTIASQFDPVIEKEGVQGIATRFILVSRDFS